MTDILIHKSSAYIKEDRDYYCSDIRDKHGMIKPCLLYTSPSPRDEALSRMPSSA